MITALSDYSTVLTRNVEPGKEALFKNPENIIDRLVEQSGTGVDGSPFLALVDPETNIILFLKTQNLETGEWGWDAANMGKLGDNVGMGFEFPWGHNSPEDGSDVGLERQTEILRLMGGQETSRIDIAGELDNSTVYRDLTSTDWKNILEKWETIQGAFNRGGIPTDIPYNWNDADTVIREASTVFKEPTYRVQHLIPNTPDIVFQTITPLNLSKDEYLKLFEFTIRSKIINFPQITKWDVSDEMSGFWVLEEAQYRPWQNLTGKSNVELTALAAQWVHGDNLNAQAYVVEDNIFDQNPIATTMQREFDKYLMELAKVGAEVDCVTIENNLWIGDPPDSEFIEEKIQFIQALGFELDGSETMVAMGSYNNSRPRRVETPNEEIAQAKLYERFVSIYLKYGIKNFGFGSIEDETAWTNFDFIGKTDANPTLFDRNFQPKLAYYFIMKALSEHLLSINK